MLTYQYWKINVDGKEMKLFIESGHTIKEGKALYGNLAEPIDEQEFMA